jgi:hypothetical protein
MWQFCVLYLLNASSCDICYCHMEMAVTVHGHQHPHMTRLDLARHGTRYISPAQTSCADHRVVYSPRMEFQMFSCVPVMPYNQLISLSQPLVLASRKPHITFFLQSNPQDWS